MGAKVKKLLDTIERKHRTAIANAMKSVSHEVPGCYTARREFEAYAKADDEFLAAVAELRQLIG